VNLLDRYFLKHFSKPFTACLIAFLLCMVVYDLYDNINDFIAVKTPIVHVLKYYLILIPDWLVLIMPFALVLALLYVLSDLSKTGEITAMRASGLDIFRLMTPFFIIGIVTSIFMLTIKLFWAPDASNQAKLFYETVTDKNKDESKELVRDIRYHDIASNRFWYVHSLDPAKGLATDVEIIQCDENNRDQKSISARYGFYNDGHWTFHQVLIYDYTLPVSDPASLVKTDLMESSDFKEAPSQLVAVFKKTKRIPTADLLLNLKHGTHLSERQRYLFSTEFHTRISFPMANFVVFLIGIPFGIIRQRHSAFLAIANALLYVVIYMALSYFLASVAERGRLYPIIAAWLPNLLFGAIGLYHIRQIR
jgi:lipopolysaccharide export system permease protein